MSIRRALLWDALNTSSVIVARALAARGWAVDILTNLRSPSRVADPSAGALIPIDDGGDVTVEQVLADHPVDALFLHGDAHVRFMRERWDRLPARVTRHLPPPDALDVALSKDRSRAFADGLGLPVLPTVRCTTPAEVDHAARELAGRHGEAVVKGEGGSSGNLVMVRRRDQNLDEKVWERLTEHSPVVLVQRRLTGRRSVATVVFDHGLERALCVHEKRRAGPGEFGVSAVGVTIRLPEVEEQAAAIFQKLRWHGLADADFREDESGRAYFLEVNPRVPSSIGLQALAGVDVVNVWTDVCAGRGPEHSPGRRYRTGVHYVWTAPDLAHAIRHPWTLPLRIVERSRWRHGDWSQLSSGGRWAAVRTALWLARRHGAA